MSFKRVLSSKIEDLAAEIESEFAARLEQQGKAIVDEQLKRLKRPATYHLFEANTTDDLDELICHFMKDGWELYGNLSVTSYDGMFWYHQAMIRFE